MSNNSLTVDEVKALRNKAEQRIADVLCDLQRKTNMPIKRVEVTLEETLLKTEIVECKIELHI